MEQYIEYIFLENFIVNLVLLYFVKTFSKQQKSNFNFFVAVVLISVYSCIMNVYSEFLNLFIVRLLAILVSLFIAFVPKKVNVYIRIFVYYCITYLSFLGSTIAITVVFNFNLENIIFKWLLYIFSFVSTYLINKFLWKMWKRSIKNDKFNIEVYIENKKLNGFIDTGNSVYGINNRQVIFIDKKYEENFTKENLVNYTYLIDVNTINNLQSQKVFVLKELNIKFKNREKIFKNVDVIFSDRILEFDALIGYDFYLEFV